MKRREKKQIVILPGEPNDANREYLPEAIRGSDMVVNENGNNSQVYPARLKEYRGCLADGLEDVWYEYVPSTYRPDQKTPLVVVHARRADDGMGTGCLSVLDPGG